MEEAAITVLRDLDVMRDNVVLRVRVIRVWRQPNRRIPNEDYSIEMILIDEHGNKIQANVFKRWFFRFERFCEENACLTITSPGIGYNPSKYKFSENPNKICFNPNTRVSKCENFGGPMYGFCFVPFQSIIDNQIPDSITIDLVGHVKRFYKNEEKDVTVQPKKRLTMEVQNQEGLSVYLTLWDEYAKQMQKFVVGHPKEEHVIVILQFARLKFFNGKPYVSNSFGAAISRLFINDDIHDINEYKSCLIKVNTDTPSSSHRPYGVSMFASTEEDFLTNTTLSRIGDIWEIQEEQPLVVLGTIKAICKEVGWYYLGCPKCTKKVATEYIVREKDDGTGDFEEEKIHQCVNVKCSSKIVDPVPRYKVQVRVQDTNGAVSLTLFHRDASELIKESASDLLTQNTVGDTVKYPDEIDCLLEKELAFKIEVSDYNLRNKYEVYGISKFTQDVNIITELKKKLNVGQVTDSESICMSSFFLDTQKESFSGTGDNVTPISNAAHDGLKDDVSHGKESSLTTIKRKLIDVYDDEESHMLSTSNVQFVSEDDKGKSIEDTNLLIPKIEK